MNYFYTNSDVKMRVGDRVLVDGRSGVLKIICEPGSKEAIDYSCADTGGLLVDDDDFGLTLTPFGMFTEVKKDNDQSGQRRS